MSAISRWAKVAGLLLLLALVGEGAAALILHQTDFATDPVDLQEPGTLLAKLDHLRRFQGTKIVLLGDSLVYGGILGDYGDESWRDHTLGALLAQRLKESDPTREVLVLNLGINGALPLDVEQLTRLVVPCGVDLLLFDTHLRPFSLDFAAPEMQYARPWLKDWSEETGLPSHVGSWQKAEAGTAAALAHWSHLFRLREFLYFRLAESEPARLLRQTRRHLNGLPTGSGEDPMVVLLQLQTRLNSVSLVSSNPQRQALERTLAYLADQQQKTVVFYARENPELVHTIVDRSKHQALYSDLARLLEGRSSRGIHYAPPCPELQAQHYLDYSHLNRAGYEVLATHLFRYVQAARGRS